MDTDFGNNTLKTLRKNLWFDAARWFATIPVDIAVQKLMERLGILHGAERVWLARVNKDHTIGQVTHEWDAKGISPTLGRQQPQSLAVYRWIYRQLRIGKEVHFNVADIPKRFDAFRRHLQLQGAKSFFGVPLFVNGAHAGVLGYHTVTTTRKWSYAERQEIRRAAVIIGEWLHIKEQQSGGEKPAGPRGEQPLLVKSGSTMLSISASKIICIEAALNYSRVHLAGEKPLLKYGGLEEWSQLLPTDRFVRIHRSYIINLAKVSKLDRNAGAWKVTMSNNMEISVGRIFRNNLLESLEKQAHALRHSQDEAV